MKVNPVEIGERYSDDSGWERRIRVDIHAAVLEIEIKGQSMSIHPRELPWLQEALKQIDEARFLDGPDGTARVGEVRV